VLWITEKKNAIHIKIIQKTTQNQIKTIEEDKINKK
jgi:hypothetical protein